MSIQNVVRKLAPVPSGSMTRTAALMGIIAAVTGPFLMLTAGGRDANNMPWYIWTMIPLILSVVLLAGYLAFKHESRGAEEISIRPRSR